MRLRPYLTLLRHNPAFSRIFAAQLISFAGDWFATVALLGLTLELSGSAAMAALVLIVQTGGFAIASPIAGVLADRFDRRRLMVAADLARVPVALAFMAADDAATLWIAIAAAALLSVLGAVFEPASSAALPNLVEEEDLPTANVLIGSAWGTMLAVGAALGGVVAVVFGRDTAFVLNAASFAASAALLVGIRRPFRATNGGTEAVALPAPGLRGSLDALASVIRFARGNRALAVLLLSKTTFGVGGGAIVMLAIFGGQVLGAGEVGIGVLFAARGLGAFLGPFLVRAIVGSSDRGLVLGIAGSFVVFAVSYALLGVVPTLALGALCVFTAHLGGGAQWTLSTYGLQRAAPDAIRGRVFSFDYGLVTLALSASFALAGLLAEQLPPTLALWSVVGLAGLAAVGWIAFARPVWRTTG